MKSISRLLFKISKFTMFSLGTVVVAGSLGLGVVGKSYSTESKSFLNTNIGKINNTLANVSEILDSAGSTKIWETVKTEMTKIKPVIEEVKSDLGELKPYISTMIQNLETAISKSSDDTQKKSLEEIKNLLVNINDNVIGSESDTISNGKNSCYAILNEFESIINDSDGIFNIDNLKNIVDNLLSTVNTVLTPVSNFFSSYNSESKVNNTYDLTTTILLSVGASILGLILIGSLLSLILYKKIDGKRVNRFNARKEIKVHISKILKRYPNIYEGLNYKKVNLFKLRIPIILKNLGIIPAYVLGGVISVGLLAGGITAISQKSFVMNALTTSSNFISDINSTATDINGQVNTLYTNLVDTDNSNSLVSQFKSATNQLENLKNQINSYTSDPTIGETMKQVSEVLDKVLPMLKTINNSISSETSTIKDVKNSINDLIGENGTITDTLTKINKTIDTINKSDSTAFQYYDLISKILIAVSSVILGIFIISFIWISITSKKVDGVLISRSHFRKNLATHLDKLFKKFPNLWNYFSDKE